jgi:hypothetical protein
MIISDPLRLLNEAAKAASSHLCGQFLGQR